MTCERYNLNVKDVDVFCIVVRKTYAVRRKGELMMITKRFERELEKLGAFEISFDMLKLSERMRNI